MINLRVTIGAFALLAIGSILGYCVSKDLCLNNEFPRLMELRSVVVNATAQQQMPPELLLPLLDIYERGLLAQDSAMFKPSLNIREEVADLNLHRYVLYSALGKKEMADKALTQAALGRTKRAIDQKYDLEFERQLAVKRYGSQPPK